MSVTVKKAGEMAAKAAAAGAAATTTTPLAVARAVSAAEAPSVTPATTSTESTMMPWRGVGDAWLEKTLGAERYQQFRRWLYFDPDDIYDLQQSPIPNRGIPISNDDPTLTHMYRHPSPGSQPPVKMPEFDDGEDPFDTNYFKKDTRRRYEFSELRNPHLEKLKLLALDSEDPDVQAELEKLEAGPQSSPGNKGVFATGPSNFDPTGLRATMSVNWQSLEESLDAHMPDHLPTPTWMSKQDELVQWYKDRDLPAPIGEPYPALNVPRERRVATW